MPIGIINMLAMLCSKPQATNMATGRIMTITLSVALWHEKVIHTAKHTIKLHKIPSTTGLNKGVMDFVLRHLHCMNTPFTAIT